MAAAAGVSDSLISRIEQGSQYGPRLSTLTGFARALRVSTAAQVRELDNYDRGDETWKHCSVIWPHASDTPRT
jgi:transcriptional regulator with XRE-family HTH domain